MEKELVMSKAERASVVEKEFANASMSIEENNRGI
jgi:hypothetical protein